MNSSRILNRGEDRGPNPAPKIGKTRAKRRRNVLPEQSRKGKLSKSQHLEPVMGKDNLNCNKQIAGQFWELKIPGDSVMGKRVGVPTILWDLRTGVWPSSHSKVSKAIPLVLLLGRGMESFWNPPESTVFFLTRSVPQQKLVNQSLNLLGYYHSLTNQREEKYLTPVSCSLPHGRRELSNFNGF